MKKFFALLLALTMVLSLAACGGSDAPTAEAPKADAPAAEAPKADAPAAAPAAYKDELNVAITANPPHAGRPFLQLQHRWRHWLPHL